MVEHESVRHLAALERLPVPALPGTRPLGMGLWTFTARVASDEEHVGAKRVPGDTLPTQTMP